MENQPVGSELISSESYSLEAMPPPPDQSTESALTAEQVMPTGQSARLRVCLITTEFHGLFKNGGIGTANTGLALALGRADVDVTVAYANSDEKGPRLKEADFLEVRANYDQLGITLDFVPANPLIAEPFNDVRSASYCVYLYLKQHQFDVVYFNDCGGQGYYSLLAKHVGALPNPPRMYVVAHGPLEWVMEINSIPYRDRWPVITAYMERRSAVLADALISPSQYLVDWMTSHGWEMPAEVSVIPNIVKLPELAPRVHTSSNPTTITELVFFGRMEVRKGLELFCDAIDLIDPAKLANVRITFLGKFSHVGGLHSGIYVVERARSWRFPLRILSTYPQDEALHYLSKPGVLAVIPSLAENLPCVVGECLALGIPFIATNSGGTAELVTPEDRAFCLIAPDRRKLAAKIESILESGQCPARPALSSAETLEKWIHLTRSGVVQSANEGAPRRSAYSLAGRPDRSAGRPSVSVCIVHSGVSASFETMLESLFEQSYPNLEIILVSYGEEGRSAPAILGSAPEGLPLQVLHEPTCDRSAARNRAASQASGQYLVFIDEELVILMPECLDVLVMAALRTGAGIITAVPFEAWGTGRTAAQRGGSLGYFPIGACAELGAFENCFGKGVLLAARRDFEQLGGFEAHCDRAIEDWLFLARATLAGLGLEVVPEPLFCYRMLPPAELNRANVVDNYRRILSAYGGQQIRIASNMFESIANLDRLHWERMQQVLARFGSEAGEIARRVSTSFEPNDPDALRGFIQFCLERHRVEDAFDFAFHNGRPLLTDALGSAGPITEKLALEAIDRPILITWHNVDLTNEVKHRVRSVSSLPAKDVVQPTVGVSQSIQAGVTILKAASVCPPETRSVRAVGRVNAIPAQSVFLAVVATAPDARLLMSEQELASEEAFWSSGWVPADRADGSFELCALISEPVERLLDLHFLCKTWDNSAVDGSVIWMSVTVSVPANSTISRSIIETSELSTPIPPRVIEQGILLTKSTEFPFPIFAPGDPTLVHPIPGKVALVRIPDAVPPGAKGVRSVVSLEHAESHPVQFAVWMKLPSWPVTSVSEFNDTDVFSGWFTVRDRLQRRRFTLRLAERAKKAMDLYLATRVVDYPDVYYCHAVWHELLILH